MALSRAGHAVPSYDMRVDTRIAGKRWVNLSVSSVDSEDGPYLVHLLRDAQKALEMARDLVRLAFKDNDPAPNRRDVPGLTPRQTEILGLLAEGRSVREICAELYLSKATARNHVRAVAGAGRPFPARIRRRGPQAGSPAGLVLTSREPGMPAWRGRRARRPRR